MRLISTEEFLHWAAARRFRLDERFPKSHSLCYVPYQEDTRFWQLPWPPAALPSLFNTILGLMQPEDVVRVGRGAPVSWHMPQPESSATWRASNRLLSGLAVPPDHKGALEYPRAEYDALLALLVTTSAFGGAQAADFYVLPDTGRYVLRTDHHDVVWVHFAKLDDIPAFVAAMSKAGFDLPTEVPDETFKVRGWISQRGGA